MSQVLIAELDKLEGIRMSIGGTPELGAMYRERCADFVHNHGAKLKAILAATPNPVRAEQPEGKGAMKLVPVELVDNTLAVLNEAIPLVVIDSNGMRSEYQDEQATEALRVRLIEARNALASAPAAPGAAVGVDDTKRLDWLEANEYDLVTRREDMGEDEYAILWFVVDSRKSTKQHLHTVSGHPLGSPREAIDAALAGKEG